MIGAVAGDIIGSIYERHPITTEKFELFSPFCRFTDDTVLTCAIADAILREADYGEKLKEWYRRYPNRGYGGGFKKWAASDNPSRRSSKGNGSAMRVSPIGWAFDTLERVLDEAQKSAEPSHNHPEGIKGAQAVAAAVFMARKGSSKEEIKNYIEQTFDYNLNESLKDIREHNRPDVTCSGSVPQAITAFLLSKDYEDAVRKAVSLGGDADTVACIAGAIAEAYYRPSGLMWEILEHLDYLTKWVTLAFSQQYCQFGGADKISDQLDTECCLDLLMEIIREQGEEVHALEWDSGGPGAGAGRDVIYKFRDFYWYHSDNGMAGPYDGWEGAFAYFGLYMVNDATCAIRSELLTAEQFAEIAEVVDSDMQGYEFTYNGQPWHVWDNKLVSGEPPG